MRLGIVDLGTLSLRFDVYEVSPGGKAELIEKHRSMPRLGEGLYTAGKLNADAAARVLSEMEIVAGIAARLEVGRIAAVGTSALRDDGTALCEQILQRTGISLRILTGEEEASLTARGILANEPLLANELLLVDIGGGSTELSYAKNRHVLASVSIELGALRLQQQFLTRGADGHYAPHAVDLANKEIHNKLAMVTLPRRVAKQIVGSSGTLRALERFRLATGKTIPRNAISEFVSKLAAISRKEALAITGMEKSRVDVIFPGTLILDAIMELFAIESVVVSHYSLRHGVLEKEITRT